MHSLNAQTLECRKMYIWNAWGVLSLLPPNSHAENLKANFHFTARQLPDTEQMNAAANKSIKSYIKTTVLSACDLRTQTQQRRGSRGGRRSGSEMKEKLNGLEESPERGSPSAPIPE